MANIESTKTLLETSKQQHQELLDGAEKFDELARVQNEITRVNESFTNQKSDLDENSKIWFESHERVKTELETKASNTQRININVPAVRAAKKAVNSTILSAESKLYALSGKSATSKRLIEDRVALEAEVGVEEQKAQVGEQRADTKSSEIVVY